MNNLKVSRREALTRAGALIGATVVTHKFPSAAAGASGTEVNNDRPFRFSLNTATIRGQKLGIVKELEIASQAGYDAIEPWVDSVEEYQKSGGAMSDLRQRIVDAGLTVEGAIGFPEWIVDDDARRAKGMERARREMDLMAQIGA